MHTATAVAGAVTLAGALLASTLLETAFPPPAQAASLVIRSTGGAASLAAPGTRASSPYAAPTGYGRYGSGQTYLPYYADPVFASFPQHVFFCEQFYKNYDPATNTYSDRRGAVRACGYCPLCASEISEPALPGGLPSRRAAGR